MRELVVVRRADREWSGYNSGYQRLRMGMAAAEVLATTIAFEDHIDPIIGNLHGLHGLMVS